MKVMNNKLLLKIFSAMIAVVLWFAITYTEDPVVTQHLTNVASVFSGEVLLHERGLTVVDKDKLPTFSATIRGNRSKVISSLGIVSASIDVSNITEAGQHEVTVEYMYPKELVTLTKAKISAFTVNVEKLISRDIPVKIKSESNGKDTKHLVALDSKIQTISVRGAQSTVEKISYAMATINTSKVSSAGTMNYNYRLYDEHNNLIDEENIISKSQNSIPVTGTIYEKAELPVKVVLDVALKSNYALKVKKQSVQRLDSGISENSRDVELLAVLSEDLVKDDKSGSARVPITVPDGVYLPEDDAFVTIDYELVPKAFEEAEVSVSAENVPQGKQVTIKPQELKVTIKCQKGEDVSKKISATIDAKELTEGIEKTVNVTLKSDDDIEVSGNYTVSALLH